ERGPARRIGRRPGESRGGAAGFDTALRGPLRCARGLLSRTRAAAHRDGLGRVRPLHGVRPRRLEGRAPAARAGRSALPARTIRRAPLRERVGAKEPSMTDVLPQGRKKTSPWVWVGLGCGGVLVLCVVVTAVAGYVLYGKVRNFGKQFEDPAVREQRVREIMGVQDFPEGYYPFMTFSVPWVLDVAIL